MLEPLSLAAGLSWGSGLRLYLTVLIAGLLARFGVIHLPDTLSVLSSPWVIGVADPAPLTVAALAGGTLAGTAHLTKAGTRALINLSPEPVSNVVTSTAEDGLVFGGLLLALLVPVLFLVLLVGFLVLASWVLPRLWRGVQGGFRGMASHMVSRLARSRHD